MIQMRWFIIRIYIACYCVFEFWLTSVLCICKSRLVQNQKLWDEQVNKPQNEKMYLDSWQPSKDSDQPAHLHSLIHLSWVLSSGTLQPLIRLSWCSSWTVSSLDTWVWQYKFSCWGSLVLVRGPSCSKLTTSLVNDSLKFTSSDTQICWNFLLKKCE